MKWMTFGCLGLLTLHAFCAASFASADLRPERIHVAANQKHKAYLKDGMWVGGDRAVDDVIVKDIRRGISDPNFERVVIDISGNHAGEPKALQRPPYYQIAVTPDEKRMVLSIWGKPKLHFNGKKVLSAFKQSSVIRNVVLLPRLEDDSWTVVFELKSESPVEVFELSNPARVILDVQRKKN